MARANIVVDANGLYHVADGEHVALVNVGPENPLALRDVLSTPEKLRPIAEATGGSARRLATTADAPIDVPRFAPMHESQIYSGPDFAGLKRTEASVLIGVARTSLAADALGLVALLGALIAMWLSESRSRARA